MQKYEDNLAANTSGALRPLSGASVVVTDSTTGLPASLYSDNGVTVLAQPLITDNDGYFGFYAPDGKYTLTFTGPRFADFVREIVLEDPEDNPYATLAQLAAPTGSNLIRHGDDSVGDVLEELTAAIAELGPGTSYNLPAATAQVLGGIKLGANLVAGTGGVVSAGLTNGAIVSALASAATAPRTHTFPDKSGTVALLSDVQAGLKKLVDVTVPTGSALTSLDWPTVFADNPQYAAFLVVIDGLLVGSGATATGAARVSLDGTTFDATSNLYLFANTTNASASMGLNYLPIGNGKGVCAALWLQNVQADGTGQTAGSDVLLSTMKTWNLHGFTVDTKNSATATFGIPLALFGALNPNVKNPSIKGIQLYFASSTISAGRVRIYGACPV